MRADAVRFRAQILKTAISTLGRDPSASLERIASDAGVHRATIYRHFPTRQVLVDAVVAQALDEGREIVRAADIEPPSLEDIRTLSASTVRYARQYAFLIGTPELTSAGNDPIGLTALMAHWQAAGLLSREVTPVWLAASFTSLAEALLVPGAVPVRSRTEVLFHSFLRGGAAAELLSRLVGEVDGRPLDGSLVRSRHARRPPVC